jgi:hypothetical protein
MAEENEYEVVRGDFSIPRDFSTCECHADELNAIDEILKDRGGVMPIETRQQYLERVVKELEEENKKLNEMLDDLTQGEG